jgi:SSS family solute:Na+ symporter
VWIGVLAYIPLGFVFYFLGTALFIFYKVNPTSGLPVKGDQMYPFFVIDQLPSGVAGLVVAAIFAAAMSSIDSAMNSASTVCVEDFVRRFSRRERPDRTYLLYARALTLVWGALGIVMAFLLKDTRYALIVWGKLMAICTNGVLGMMALAFLPFRVRTASAVTGFAASAVALAIMMPWNLDLPVLKAITDGLPFLRPAAGFEINFLLWPVVGNTVCFLTALLVNRCLGPRE